MLSWAIVGVGLVAACASSAFAAGSVTPGNEEFSPWRDAITPAIAVTGAVLGLLNYWTGVRRERAKKRGDATYLALRLAVIFEAYAAACANIIAENNLEWLPNGAPYNLPNPGLPILHSYPEDGEGWKALNSSTASACLDFRNRVDGSGSKLAASFQIAGQDIEEEVRDEATARGLEAWALALKLRKELRLSAIVPVFPYADRLEAERSKLLSDRSERYREARERKARMGAAISVAAAERRSSIPLQDDAHAPGGGIS